MKVLGIDPGFRACGVAYFDGVWQAVTVRPKGRGLWPRVCEILRVLGPVTVDVLVVERPQIYEQRLMKGDPNDEVMLAVLVGALARHVTATKVLLPTPHDWKGQTPKDISHARIRKRLPALGVCSKDALDAVGLALYGVDHA